MEVGRSGLEWRSGRSGLEWRSDGDTIPTDSISLQYTKYLSSVLSFVAGTHHCGMHVTSLSYMHHESNTHTTGAHMHGTECMTKSYT